MPASPAMGERLAASTVELYAEAERKLLARVARNVAQGIDAPYWVEQKLAQMREYQRQAQAVVDDLAQAADATVTTATTEAYKAGGLSAVADLSRAGMDASGIAPLGGMRAVEAMAAETLGNVVATHPRILRTTMDAYRSVIAQAAPQVLLGTQTRRQAAQTALNEFAKKGITGFVDKAGRGWSMDSYVEMATRTGTGKAFVQGHIARLSAAGVDLVIVSDAPKECPLCRPWEGRVLSLSGSNPEYPSLDDAVTAGLQHCNCRHSLSMYQEGITKPMGETADPQGYRDTQKLRYLERKVRESKRMQAGAIDDVARAKATRRLEDYRGKIRSHVSSTTAKRQPWRESMGVSKKALGGPTVKPTPVKPTAVKPTPTPAAAVPEETFVSPLDAMVTKAEMKAYAQSELGISRKCVVSPKISTDQYRQILKTVEEEQRRNPVRVHTLQGARSALARGGHGYLEISWDGFKNLGPPHLERAGDELAQIERWADNLRSSTLYRLPLTYGGSQEELREWADRLGFDLALDNYLDARRAAGTTSIVNSQGVPYTLEEAIAATRKTLDDYAARAAEARAAGNAPKLPFNVEMWMDEFGFPPHISDPKLARTWGVVTHEMGHNRYFEQLSTDERRAYLNGFDEAKRAGTAVYPSEYGTVGAKGWHPSVEHYAETHVAWRMWRLTGDQRWRNLVADWALPFMR